jgi:hypothetical protein
MRLGLGGLLAGLVLAAPGASKKDDKGKAESKKKPTQEQLEAAALAEPFAPEHPQIIMNGLRCQIHRDGKVQQDIRAKTGQFDELANILDLDQLNVKYLDEGTTIAGQLDCGRGRVWTTAHPEKGINAHDMLLQQGVRLQTKDLLKLQSPEMRYNAQASTISSDKGYQQQMPMGKKFMIGKGQRFELKLLVDKNSFEYWKAFGNPAEMRKSEKPVLNP